MLNKQVLEYKDFGIVQVKLNQIMTEKDITNYQLSNKANVRFQTIQKLREGTNVTRVNLDVVAKLCYVLECKVEDLFEYKEA